MINKRKEHTVKLQLHIKLKISILKNSHIKKKHNFFKKYKKVAMKTVANGHFFS